MLYFSKRPDSAFSAIVTNSLEMAIDTLRDEGIPDDDAMNSFCKETSNIFARPELLQQCRALLDAHKSSKLFRITDYHFLILYDVIDGCVEVHNEMWLDDKTRLIKNVNEIDTDSLADLYFWDTDFLFNPSDYDNIPHDVKKDMLFNEETFGVIHGLKPHAEETALEEMEIPDDWGRMDKCFRKNSDYPYYEPEDDAGVL